MPVGAYRADELRRFLVEDAVKQHATDLPWMVGAIRRIGNIEHKPLDDVLVSIEAEVVGLTGRGMPVYSGPIQ